MLFIYASHVDERQRFAVLSSGWMEIALRLVTESYYNFIPLYVLIGLTDVTQRMELCSLSACSLGHLFV